MRSMERLSTSNPSVQFWSLMMRLEEILRSLDQHFEACDAELQDLRRQVSQSRDRARALSEEGAQKNQQSRNEAEKRIETDKENRVLRAALDDAITCLSAYLEVHAAPKPQTTRAPSPSSAAGVRRRIKQTKQPGRRRHGLSRGLLLPLFCLQSSPSSRPKPGPGPEPEPSLFSALLRGKKANRTNSSNNTQIQASTKDKKSRLICSFRI